MLRAVALAALLSLASQAQADVFAFNDASDPANKVNLTVKNEWVNGLLVRAAAQIITIPPRQPEQFHVIRLCHDGNTLAGQPWIASAPRFETAPWTWPSTPALPPNCKNVSAWGTLLNTRRNASGGITGNDATDLIRAVQHNSEFSNHADEDFDDCSVPVGPPSDPNNVGCGANMVNGQPTWFYRASHGCWPPGLQSGVYFRGEARRVDSAGMGQISIAGGFLVENTQQSFEAFRSQAKGYTELNQPDVSADHLLIPIPAGSFENLFALFINPGHRGTVHCSGWRMRPQ